MAIPAKNILGNPNVTEGSFQIAIEQLRESVIGSGKAYDSANTYSQYDTCISGGVTYYSKVNGNIGNTPAVNTYWGDKADLISGVVHKTGNETISGVKEFTSNPVASSATEANIQLSKTGTGASVFYPYNGVTQLGLADTVMGTIAYMNKTLPTDFIINKNLYVVGNIISSAGAGIGYGTGSGGTVTQLTSKSTAVTINKPSGRIVTHNASLEAGGRVQFSVANNIISLNDNILLTNAANYNYEIFVSSVLDGAFQVSITNKTGVSIADSLNINFAVIKGSIN